MPFSVYLRNGMSDSPKNLPIFIFICNKHTLGKSRKVIEEISRYEYPRGIQCILEVSGPYRKRIAQKKYNSAIAEVQSKITTREGCLARCKDIATLQIRSPELCDCRLGPQLSRAGASETEERKGTMQMQTATSCLLQQLHSGLPGATAVTTLPRPDASAEDGNLSIACSQELVALSRDTLTYKRVCI